MDLSRLNSKQRDAVVSTAKRLLVLAGAGSGKTRTLLQKIIYLVEKEGVSPSNILAITFTKSAAYEMVDRLIISADKSNQYKNLMNSKNLTKKEKEALRFNYQQKYKWIKGLTIKTFHGFCYSILRNYGVKEFDNKFKIIGDKKLSKDEDLSKRVAPETVFDIFHKLFIQQCDDTAYLIRLKRYVLDYIVDKVHIKKRSHTYMPKDGKYFTALDGTKVRSKSEQYIADWFYRHGIKYEYEPLVNIKDFDFRPDFYIPAADLYIEHVSDKSYPVKDKEKQFKKANISLLKTNDEITKDTFLFNKTLDKAIKNKISSYYKNTPLTYREAFQGCQADFKRFIIQVIRITDMMKVENIDFSAVWEKAKNDPHERVREFYNLAIPVVKKYIAYCIDKSYLDFNDLILRSISLFRNYPDITNRYKAKYQYILVDEFQDVNNLQVELIKLLLTDKTQLFCVGDDWQSIYGFRGSNVNYIINFEQHFIHSTIIKLNLNYRSTHNIVEASNEVIKHNKLMVKKDIFASKKSEHKIVVYAGNSLDDNINYCMNKVKELKKEGIKRDDIMFLYRRSKMASKYQAYFKKERIKVNFKTIHSAKGLESKVVFILGLTEGYGGFPDIWLEDRIFQMIKTANHDLLLEEERTLFYVAITRAKDELFLISEMGNESSFLNEIPDVFTYRTNKPFISVIKKTSQCSKCNKQIEEHFIYCPFCGSMRRNR